jgi:hypothetical protein
MLNFRGDGNFRKTPEKRFEVRKDHRILHPPEGGVMVILPEKRVKE